MAETARTPDFDKGVIGYDVTMLEVMAAIYRKMGYDVPDQATAEDIEHCRVVEAEAVRMLPPEVESEATRALGRLSAHEELERELGPRYHPEYMSN